MGMQGFYFGGYPWRDFGILSADDLNAAIALALSPVRAIPAGSITNIMLANPWVQIGTTQIQLGTAVNTLSGVLDPVNSLDVANKHYVDQHIGGGGGGGGIEDAPADGNTYGRYNATWTQVVPIAGGVTVAGPLTLTGLLSANLGLVVNGGLTIQSAGSSAGLAVVNGGITSRTISPGMPNASGNTVPPSLTGRFFDNSGATMDIGSNGSSGLWINATNANDQSQRYPLLLQPLGGDTRMGGNVWANALTLTGGPGVSLSLPNGSISAQSLTLAAPLGLVSGGTNAVAAAHALPATLAGMPPWTSALEVSTGTNLQASNGSLGYWAKTAGYDLYGIGVGNQPYFTFIRINGTLAAPAPVAAGDALGGVYANGWNGSQVTGNNAAAIQFAATSAWTVTNEESEIVFWTCRHNYNVPWAAMVLDGAGNVTIQGGLTVPGGASIGANGLAVAGGINAGSQINSTGSNAGLFFQDRTSGRQWAWYGTTDAVELFNGASNVVTITPSGGLYCFGLNTNNGGVSAGSGPLAGGTANIGTGGINNSGGYAQSGVNGNTFTGGVNMQGGLSITSGGFSAGAMGATSLQLNGPGSTVLDVTNGGISVAGASTFGGQLWAPSFLSNSMQLNGGGGSVLYVPNGGIYVAGMSQFGDQVQVQAGGNAALYAVNGGITVNGYSELFGGMLIGTEIHANCNVFPGSDNAYDCGLGNLAWQAVFSYQFIQASDANRKVDIALLPDNCLDLVGLINPRRYHFVDDPTETRHLHWGFIAQEVGDVMERADLDFGGHQVSEQGTHMLAYSELTAMLWKAVQELSAKVTALEAR